MKEITTAITEIKSKISMDEWRQRIIDCQSSGKSIKVWCRENGIATSSYYHYLRKIRESVLEENQLVSIEKPTISKRIRIRRNYDHSSRKCLPGAADRSSVRIEIMLKEIASVTQVYLFTGYTDLRLGSTVWQHWFKVN